MTYQSGIGVVSIAYAKTRVIHSTAVQLRYVLHYALPIANSLQLGLLWGPQLINKIVNMMKVKPILPIDALHGKLDGKSTYYFRTINGKQYAQRCPKRDKPPTDSQLSSRAAFAERSRLVAQMQKDGSKLTVKELWKSIM